MSLWEMEKKNVMFPKLEKDLEVNTLIVGGGIAGFTCFYYLKNHPSVALVDASRIGGGVTKNTTGKLTYLQGAIYSRLLA